MENTFNTQSYRKMRNLCDVHLFIRSYFIHQQIYLYVKHVFNAWHSCINCIDLWMNKLYIIFIINLSHVKFVMYVEMFWMIHYISHFILCPILDNIPKRKNIQIVLFSCKHLHNQIQMCSYLVLQLRFH